MDRDTRDSAIIRDLLERIDESPEVSQRMLSKQLDIALGMTNAYLKRCIKKGWVKLRQAPARRYRYYLTPRGFAEKSRLTAEYFSDSLRFFRRARDSFDRLYETLARRGVDTVVLCGSDELTEIGVLCAQPHAIAVTGVLRDDSGNGAIGGAEVIGGTPPEDALLVVATTANAGALYRGLVARFGGERVVYPEVLDKVIGERQ